MTNASWERSSENLQKIKVTTALMHQQSNFWPSCTLNVYSLSLMCCIADYKFQMSFIPLFWFQTMERFLYASLILVHISQRQRGWMDKCVQIHPGKMKARGFFFSMQKLIFQKREKNPSKDEPNECNKCTNVSLLAFWPNKTGGQ